MSELAEAEGRESEPERVRGDWDWRDRHEAEAHAVAKEMALARERYVRYLAEIGDKPLMEYREEEARWVAANEERVRSEA